MIGRFHAWRASVRIAWRDIGRNRGRSALIALMVALPVLATATAAVVYRSQEWDVRDELQAEMGSAQARVLWQATQPIEQSPDAGGLSSISESSVSWADLTPAQYGEMLATRIPKGDRLIAERWLPVSTGLRSKGGNIATDLREIDYSDPGVKGLIKQTSGRAPAAPGEVVIGNSLRWRGLSVGDQLTYRPTPTAAPKTLTIVGTVVSHTDNAFDTVIGMPGTLLPEAPFALTRAQREGGRGDPSPVEEWLVAGSAPVSWATVQDLNTIGALVTSRAVITDPPRAAGLPFSYSGSDHSNLRSAAVVSILAALALLQTALLAGPAIAVGARRNRRGLALMAAAGAGRRHLRTVVLAANGLIGLAASVVAAALGAGLGALVVAGVRHWTDIDIIRIDIHLTDLLALVVAGAGTAIAAALIPAHQVARMDVVATLTGRRGRAGRPVRRLLPVAGTIVGAAGVVLALRSTRGSGVNQLPVVTGLALFEIGLVMTAGTVVAVAARPAGHLPFSFRFALRDASRQRSRTAPAVAAVLAAVAGGTAGLVYLASADNHYRQAHVAVGAPGVVRVTASPGGVLGRAEATLAGTLGTSRIAQYQVMQAEENGRPATLESQRPTSAERTTATGAELFDDGTALQVFSGGRAARDAAQLKAGKAVVPDPSLLWPGNTVRMIVHHSDGKTTTVTLPAVRASSDSGFRETVFPITAAKRLDVRLVPGGLVAQAPRKLSDTEVGELRATLRRTGEVSGVSVEQGYQSNYGVSILALIMAALVISLLGTFTAVGLAAAESREDVSTLAAVGAAPGLRRRLTAAQGGVIAGLGTWLGLGAGILAGYVLIRLAAADGRRIGSPGDWPLVLPWPTLLLVGLGIPLLATSVGFLTTRSRPTVARRLGQ